VQKPVQEPGVQGAVDPVDAGLGECHRANHAGGEIEPTVRADVVIQRDVAVDDQQLDGKNEHGVAEQAVYRPEHGAADSVGLRAMSTHYAAARERLRASWPCEKYHSVPSRTKAESVTKQ